MGGGAGAARDPGAIAASGQDVITPTMVSVKQTVQPAQTVLSSSCIIVEGKSDFTHLAYHTLDALLYVSLSDGCDASKQGEGAVATVHEVVLPDAHGSHAPGVPDDLSLWGSSMFRSEKSGLRPFNSEDPLCATVNSVVDGRLVADDSLTVVMRLTWLPGLSIWRCSLLSF